MLAERGALLFSFDEMLLCKFEADPPSPCVEIEAFDEVEVREAAEVAEATCASPETALAAMTLPSDAEPTMLPERCLLFLVMPPDSDR